MTPTVTDRTPLLENGGPVSHHPFSTRLSSFFKAEGQPSWIASYKYLFFGSWWNIFLFFVPLSVLAHKLAWDATVCFWFSFCAIIPLAKVSCFKTMQFRVAHPWNVASGRSYGRNVCSSWANSRWLAQCILRKCG
jgi:hypothetical protein